MPLYNPLSSTDTIGQSYEISNLGLATSVAASALTIKLKQADGTTNPGAGASAVKVGMRSSTLTSGLYNQRSVATATSLVISSGSTLGQASGLAARLYIYLLDNAGTLELAVSQKLFSEDQVVSTTAEGGAGAADSATVMYSTTARTNVPFRLVGYLLNTQTTAGTWASAGTKLQVGSYASLTEERFSFSANSSTTAATTSTPFIYTNVLDNTGSMYNAATGVATAIVAGFYSLVGTAYDVGNHSINVYKNGVRITQGATLGTSANSSQVSWNGPLNAGDTVEIRPNSNVTAAGQAWLNTFSGFLVK